MCVNFCSHPLAGTDLILYLCSPVGLCAVCRRTCEFFLFLKRFEINVFNFLFTKDYVCLQKQSYVMF